MARAVVAAALLALCGGADAGAQQRTKAEVEALIAEAGRTPPDWWDSVPLAYPKTLDLAWPRPGKGWNPRKHIGHYMFSVVNENPGRWRAGTRFMHHVLSVNKGRPDVQRQAMGQLAHCYHDLLGDWARAAYWHRKAGVEYLDQAVGLADCYWKLGSKEMAAELLARVRTDFTRYGSAIKLWSDMGEFGKAMELAGASAHSGNPGGAYMGAGDACRKHGRFQQATAYYRKVHALPMPRKDGILTRNKGRARAAIDTLQVFEAFDLSRIPDGTYTGASLAYNGDLTVAVTVKAGRIQAVRIVRHKDKQYFSALTDTPKEIVAKQDLRRVDATTAATVTSEAVVHATAKALRGAMR